MSKYRVEVVVSYWQTIEVQAQSKAEAEATALDLFDIAQARQGEIIEAIFEKYPLDNPENVPDWPWLPWGPLIREDWSDELTDSLDAAEAHLQD